MEKLKFRETVEKYYRLVENKNKDVHEIVNSKVYMNVNNRIFINNIFGIKSSLLNFKDSIEHHPWGWPYTKIAYLCLESGWEKL